MHPFFLYTETMSIPVLDLEALTSRDQNEIDNLNNALRDHGFFSISNHSIDQNFLEEIYSLSEDFFNLSETTKNKYAFPENGGARGYTPFGKETALGENIADLKEFWHHGPKIDQHFDTRIHKNISVKEIDHFSSRLEALFSELNQLGVTVLDAIAYILDKEKDFFKPWVEYGNSVLRLIHYPPVSSDENLMRARPHEDINLITLLVGAKEPGLEVLDKSGNWIKVPPSNKNIVCNIGDMMQLVTRDQLKSTTHRVMDYQEKNPKSRYSIPFFLHPSPNVTLESIVDDSPESISAHDFLEERIRAIGLY